MDINSRIVDESFKKLFDLVLPFDIAFNERNLPELTKHLNETMPILRDIALHIKNREISLVLLNTSNECESLINKLQLKRANFDDISVFISRAAANFASLLQTISTK